MKHFNGFTDYLQFALAKEFIWNDGVSKTSFNFPKKKYEEIGNLLTKPILQPIDFSLRNGRNPLFIAAITVGAIFMTTLLFYPAVFSGIFTATVIASIKAIAFTTTQLGIIGLGLRTLGRLDNQKLMKEWDQQNLLPQRIGALKI